MSVQEFVKRWGKTIVIVLLCIFLVKPLMGAFHDMRHLPHPKTIFIVACAAMFFIQYLISALGWHLVLHGLNQPASLLTSFRMFYMSMLARWLPGRVWYTATRLLLAKEAGLSMTAVGFGIVFELIYNLVGGAIATVAFSGPLLSQLISTPGGKTYFGIVLFIILSCAAVAVRPSTLLWLCRFGFFRRTIKKMAGEDLTPDNQPRMSTPTGLGLVLFYTGYWIYSGFMLGVLAEAFIPMTPNRWIICIPAFAASWLAGFFSVLTPAGLGVREVVMIVILQQAMPKGYADVLTLSSRVVMVLTELASAGLMTLLLGNKTPPPWKQADALNVIHRSEEPVEPKNIIIGVANTDMPTKGDDPVISTNAA